MHVKNRVIAILPQFFINIFTDDFQKTNYIFLTADSLMNQKYYKTYFSINDVGSSLAETKLVFGIFFFLPLMIISYFAFMIFDSFYNNKTKTFSPIIVVVFYFSGASILNFFASASFDIMILTFLRELPQTIILFLFTQFFYKKITIKNNI